MSLYLTLAIMLALFTLTAVVKARRLHYGAIPWFFAGWLTGELAWFHLTWSLLLSLLVILGGGLDSSAGHWGLGLFVLSWLGLALSLIHISEPTRLDARSRMPSSA